MTSAPHFTKFCIQPAHNYRMMSRNIVCMEVSYLFDCCVDGPIRKLNSVALVRKRTRPSDRRLSAKLLPTFRERGCRVVSATDPHGR
jgi:hypothetical protein